MMTPLRVAQSIAANVTGGESSSAVTGTYLNDSGDDLDDLIPVMQTSSGTLETIDVSIEADVRALLGLTAESILDNVSGLVALDGLLKEVTTSFQIGDVLYISKARGLTTSVPDIGIASFVEGDFVVKIGRVTKNSDNGSLKDLKLELEILGQL